MWHRACRCVTDLTDSREDGGTLTTPIPTLLDSYDREEGNLPLLSAR